MNKETESRSESEQAQNQGVRSPEETKLDFLIGDWLSSDRMSPGPFGPGGTSEGVASYRWEVGDKWLIYDFKTNLPGVGS